MIKKLKEVKDLRKYLLFISGIISIIGFIVAGNEAVEYSSWWSFVVWVEIWSWFSAPFIIMLLYNLIFRKK